MFQSEGESEEGESSSLGMLGRIKSIGGEQRDYALQKNA